jgi:pSer/pThr/pTyr-binding forkhead associated (FHA) protein
VVDNVPWLVDLGSRNGTMLNGVSVTLAPLKPGDRITLGSTEFKVDSTPLPNIFPFWEYISPIIGSP